MLTNTTTDTAFILDFDDTLWSCSHLCSLGCTPHQIPTFLDQMSKDDLDAMDSQIVESLKNLPTNYLNLSDEAKMYLSPEILEFFKDLIRLDQVVVDVLNRTLEYGRVYIVTNSDTGWIELITRQFLPRTHQRLFIDQQLPIISVISAKTNFEKKYPKRLMLWKYLVFSDIVQLDSSLKTLIGLGDSEVEYQALNQVQNFYPQIQTKFVKFHEKPTCDGLIRQLSVIMESLPLIVAHQGHLSLKLHISPSMINS